MKTEMRMDYRAFGKKPDGTWKWVTPYRNSVEETQELLEEYKCDVESAPDLFVAYEEYEIRKRLVITTWGDWEVCE
jgi:hypothetical protein